NDATQVTLDIGVAKSDQTISGLAADPTSGVVDGSSTLSATASSGLPVSFGSSTPSICSVTGSTVSYSAIGTCTVTADQAGDDDYNPATQVTIDIDVSQGSQVITLFNLIPGYGYVGSTSTLVAVASSGLTVTFASITPSVCTVSGNTVSFLTEGLCSVTADQAGDENYAAAPQLTLDIDVALTPPTAIPTLSAWGLLTMFLIMLGFGGLVIRRKQSG
ncbi:MAG: IPTL-CTERM sorting domain-containing protein, partial [Xanthomonadales bacterium]|nr:IPTL-CTERM sorting domain-containing protein [Gammaproteobacteria bacterium]NNK03478.1 IPTL-CTERM sorting domain-containing protein [Xanthomonadales bacterium]